MLFMHGRFSPIRLLCLTHVKGSKSLHFEKKNSLLHRFKLISRVVEQMVNVLTLLTCNIENFASLFRFIDTYPQTYRGVLVFLDFRKILVSARFVEFLLGRFLHLYIAVAYSNSTFRGVCTPSFCEFTQNFSKTSTPQATVCTIILVQDHESLTDLSPGHTEQLHQCQYQC